jgi:alpha-aminoadipate/glutamate carrier protein LysW
MHDSGRRAYGAGSKKEIEMINCPLCKAVIDVDEDELDAGDAIMCEECGTTLNVSGVSPLELTPGDDDDEDDDDDDDLEDFEEEEDDEDDDEDDEE